MDTEKVLLTYKITSLITLYQQKQTEGDSLKHNILTTNQRPSPSQIHNLWFHISTHSLQNKVYVTLTL